MSGDASNLSCARVLIVDDSSFMRNAIVRMIAPDPRFEVVGTACSGNEALQKIPTLDPDVVTLDLQMPGLDGLETLRRIMQQFPRPVIVVSATIDKDPEVTFQALSLGAFDFVPKHLSSATLEIRHIRDDLIAKLQAATKSRKVHSETISRKPPLGYPPRDNVVVPVLPAIVAIGASTGGPTALEQILPRLPHDLPVPIVVVQHMPVGFTGTLARRLDSICNVPVREAANGEIVQPGVIYIAPAGSHMVAERSQLPKFSSHLVRSRSILSTSRQWMYS